MWVALAAPVAGGQESHAPVQEPKGPPVKINILNVCAPTDSDQKDMSAALARIPHPPRFGPDYEVDRGHSTNPQGAASDWVRVRHDFLADSPFSTAQYQFSVATSEIREGVVLQLRELKDVTQISFENLVTDGSAAETVLATDTPVHRIRVERFGKNSLGLVRCTTVDQSSYEPLFQTATQLMKSYRAALGARRIVPGELQRLRGQTDSARRPPTKSVGKHE